MRRVLASAFAAAALLATLTAPLSMGAAATSPAAGWDGPATATLPAKPNIVVFYIDDAPPNDGRLWDDPNRTPNLYDQFIAHGIKLDHAIGETPLCCPARANVLTGLHTHNTRVVENNAQLFDPSEHIGKALKDVGYASMWIGKYLNCDNTLTPDQWDAHDAGWTVLDAILGNNGAFYNYALHTKTGTLHFTDYHSTQMVADRAVMHFKQTPANQPIFAMLSIYNVHSPNVPQKQDINDPRCANIPPWDPPNYNEADVSDKPQYIQHLPLQPYPNGWPMVRYCQEMLGVDRAVGEVLDELRAENRLDNTLLMFTADNGMAWGQHRLGQVKSWPYATPVPLYVRWPAAHWGDTPQTISEIVSNIDYAPTWCALAGDSCQLGPFDRGSTGPDGVSLVPLLNGDATNLGRDAVLEESYASPDNSWSGLRTTELFDPDHRWHYIEYTDGEVELYDLVNDPWELNNLAHDSNYSSLIATLHTRLGQLRVQGIGSGNGTIIIGEDATPDYGFDYHFSGDLGNFTLDDDGGTDSQYSNSITFANIPSGPYTITRPANLPWASGGTVCDGVGVDSSALGKLVVYLHPDEVITCTWVDAIRQPDAAISLHKHRGFKLNNFYTSTAVDQQTVRRSNVVPGRTYTYYVHLQNDSSATDSFTVHVATSGPSGVATTYSVSGKDQTNSFVTDQYVANASAKRTIKMRVQVNIPASMPLGSVYQVVLTFASESDPSKVDVVRLIASR